MLEKESALSHFPLSALHRDYRMLLKSCSLSFRNSQWETSRLSWKQKRPGEKSGAWCARGTCGLQGALRILMIKRVCASQRICLGNSTQVETLRTKAFLSFATREAVLFWAALIINPCPAKMGKLGSIRDLPCVLTVSQLVWVWQNPKRILPSTLSLNFKSPEWLKGNFIHMFLSHLLWTHLLVKEICSQASTVQRIAKF